MATSIFLTPDSGINCAMRDVITNFDSGDIIDLSLIDADTTTSGDLSFINDNRHNVAGRPPHNSRRPRASCSRIRPP